MQQLYPYFIKFHVVFSVVFLLVAIAISLRSLQGWVKKRNYTKFDKTFTYTFLAFLYVDLVLGIVLYFFLRNPEDITTVEQAVKYSSLRFWAVQHFSNMIFVVILSQIGSIFISKTVNAVRKFKYAFLYFGSATVITLISVGIFMFQR